MTASGPSVGTIDPRRNSQRPPVSVHFTWETGGKVEVSETPLYAHLPWEPDPTTDPEIDGESDPLLDAATTASIAGRCGALTNSAYAADSQERRRRRPPIVVRAWAPADANLVVRFRYLKQSLAFSNGDYVGSAAPSQAEPSQFIAMHKAGGAAGPSNPGGLVEWLSEPLDPQELVGWLESNGRTSSALNKSERLVDSDRFAGRLRSSVAGLDLLTSDRATSHDMPVGIGNAYKLLGEEAGATLPKARGSWKRPVRIAWVHSEEYWWVPKERAPRSSWSLAPVFPVADLAQAVVSNLRASKGFVIHGGAMLGRFAGGAPSQVASEKGKPVLTHERTGWFGAGDVRTVRLGRTNPMSALTLAQLDCPWTRAPDDLRHSAAIARPSARQVLFSGGLMAIRAEVFTSNGDLSSVQEFDKHGRPPASLAPRGDFDFLVRYPADLLCVANHVFDGGFFAAARVGHEGGKKWTRIFIWEDSLRRDRESLRAPWAVPLPGNKPSTVFSMRRAPVVSLVGCNMARDEVAFSALNPRRDFRPGGTEDQPRSLLAVFGCRGTWPVFEFCLPTGGSVALGSLQAAVAGRAIGVLLQELQTGGPRLDLGTKSRSRSIPRERVVDVLRAFTFWLSVLAADRDQMGVVCSFWGSVDPGLDDALVSRLRFLRFESGMMEVPERVEAQFLPARVWQNVAREYESGLAETFVARHRELRRHLQARPFELRR